MPRTLINDINRPPALVLLRNELALRSFLSSDKYLGHHPCLQPVLPPSLPQTMCFSSIHFTFTTCSLLFSIMVVKRAVMLTTHVIFCEQKTMRTGVQSDAGRCPATQFNYFVIQTASPFTGLFHKRVFAVFHSEKCVMCLSAKSTILRLKKLLFFHF
jgi:hypothetical protein